MKRGTEIVVGDWVRFPLNGELRIGVVEYVLPAESWMRNAWEVVTDKGRTDEVEIMEVRGKLGIGADGAGPAL